MWLSIVFCWCLCGADTNRWIIGSVELGRSVQTSLSASLRFVEEPSRMNIRRGLALGFTRGPNRLIRMFTDEGSSEMELL